MPEVAASGNPDASCAEAIIARTMCKVFYAPINKITSLKPTKPVRVSMAAAEAVAREVNLGSGALGVRKNLFGWIGVTHKRTKWPKDEN